MSYMEEITGALGELDRWQCVCVAAGCVEHVAPLVRRLGTTVTKERFEQYLSRVWEAARERAGGADIVEARAAVEELSESSTDDSHRPAYYVMRAIGVLASALETIINEDYRSGACD